MWVVNARDVCILTKQNATVKLCMPEMHLILKKRWNLAPSRRRGPCLVGVRVYLGLGAHLGLELLLSVTFSLSTDIKTVFFRSSKNVSVAFHFTLLQTRKAVG